MTDLDHGGHDAIELIAAFVLIVGGAIFTPLSLRMRPARPRLAATVALDTVDGGRSANGGAVPSVGRSLVFILAGLSAGGAAIHLVAAPNHFDEIGDLAMGFVAAAAFQGLWIRWCLAGPSRRAILVGIVGNLTIVGAWAWTRTVGLPVGPFAGGAEPIGYPDMASIVFELLLVVGLVARWLGLDARLAASAVARAIVPVAVVPVLGLVLVLSSLAAVSIASGLDHGGPAAHPIGPEHVAAS